MEINMAVLSCRKINKKIMSFYVIPADFKLF